MQVNIDFFSILGDFFTLRVSGQRFSVNGQCLPVAKVNLFRMVWEGTMMADGRWQFSTRHLKVGDKIFNIYIIYILRVFLPFFPPLYPVPK